MWRRFHLSLLSLLLLALPATTVLCEACLGGECAIDVQPTPAASAAEMIPCHVAMEQETSTSPSFDNDGVCCQMSAPASTRTAVPVPHALDEPGFGAVAAASAFGAPAVTSADERGDQLRPPRLRAPLYTLHSSLLL